MPLRIAPITLRAANQYVADLHRHHRPTTGHKFSVSVTGPDGTIHGVAIVGRPTSRHFDGAGYLEVLRVATDGTRNACSMLYGAAARAGTALGYPRHKIITYTLETENGASLRAANWFDSGPAGGGSWSRPSRPRQDAFPTMEKRRWHAAPPPADQAP